MHQFGKPGKGAGHSLNKRAALDVRETLALQRCSDEWPPHIAAKLGLTPDGQTPQHCQVREARAFKFLSHLWLRDDSVDYV